MEVMQIGLVQILNVMHVKQKLEHVAYLIMKHVKIIHKHNVTQQGEHSILMEIVWMILVIILVHVVIEFQRTVMPVKMV